MRQRLFFHYITVIIGVSFYAAVSSPSPGSYTTTRPSTITDPPAPSITDNIKGPVLTTDWCASLAFSDTSETMFAHPLAFRCTRSGLLVGYPGDAVVRTNYYVTPFNGDINVTVKDIKPGKALMDWYGDWAVRASWDDGKLTATMAHGSPFVYFDAEGTVEITFSAKASIFRLEGSTVGVSVGGRYYGICIPPVNSISPSASKVSFSITKNYPPFSVCILPDTLEETFSEITGYGLRGIRKTEVSWWYDQAAAGLCTRYEILGEEGGAHLIALYPHQWQYYTGKLTPYTYNSARGIMKVISASQFTTIQPYTGILPHLPLMARDGSNGFSRSTLEGFIATEAAKNANALIRANEDTYWTGKDFGRTAQLVRIADQLGNTASRDYFLGVIKSKLEDWCVADAGETSECFYYNRAWGTLIGARPSYDSDKSLNDHHFHYGYFVYAAATVAQYDRGWALKWKPMIDLIIRDCNSPLRDDSLFPFMRSFDVYAGHSWASGNALFTDGNNQESTSEAVNFAAGTALWGMATGDTLLRDLGIFLYTTEKNALLNYWFDVHETVFPPSYGHTMAGVVWGDKAAYETWFSAEPECIHGINMLPVTAASLYLGCSPAYIRKNFAEIEKNNGGPINEWFDILWEYLALGDPADAAARLAANTGYTPENGESRAHTYHWVHNLVAAGTVDTGVTAAAPSYAVFSKGGRKTYTVWNPEGRETPVSFSDGSACTVPAGTLAAFSQDEMAPVQLQSGATGQAVPPIQVRSVPGGYRISVSGRRAGGRLRLFDCTGRLVQAVTLSRTGGGELYVNDKAAGSAGGVLILSDGDPAATAVLVRIK